VHPSAEYAWIMGWQVSVTPEYCLCIAPAEFLIIAMQLSFKIWRARVRNGQHYIHW
jgi:hypothetical protein